MNTTQSEKLYAQALDFMPGGVNSPVRACRSVGRTPLFIDRAEGSKIYDVDGNEFIDYICSWGPNILGHKQPDVIKAVTSVCQNGLTFGACHSGEIELAELIRKNMPSIEMLRLVNSGTEAVMSAIRAAGLLPRPFRRFACKGRFGTSYKFNSEQRRCAERLHRHNSPCKV